MSLKVCIMILSLFGLTISGIAQSETINTAATWDQLYHGEIADTTPITYTFTIESDGVLALYLDLHGEVFVQAAIEQAGDEIALPFAGFLSQTVMFYQSVSADSLLRLTIDPSIGTIIPGTRYEFQASVITDVTALAPVPTNARLDLSGDTPYQLFQLDATMGDVFTHTIGDTAGVAYFHNAPETPIAPWPDLIDGMQPAPYLMIRDDGPNVIAVFRYEPTIVDLTTAILPSAQPDVMFYVRLTPENPIITIPLEFHGAYRLFVQASGPFEAEIKADAEVTVAAVSGIGSWYLTPFQLAETVLEEYSLTLSAPEFRTSGDDPTLELYVMVLSDQEAD